MQKDDLEGACALAVVVTDRNSRGRSRSGSEKTRFLTCYVSNSVPVAVETAPRWAFLTNHAQVLVCIASEPGLRLRDISDRVGITERAAHCIVDELSDAGYIPRKRTGRRNTYFVHADRHLPDALARKKRVGNLLAILVNPT